MVKKPMRPKTPVMPLSQMKPKQPIRPDSKTPTPAVMMREQKKGQTPKKAR